MNKYVPLHAGQPDDQSPTGEITITRDLKLDDCRVIHG